MSLSQAVFRYLVCVGITYVLFKYGSWKGVPEAYAYCLWFYIFAGIYLNRRVYRKLVTYHPMYDTLQNVVADKLVMFGLWPLTYLRLFGSLLLNRLL
ncbi:hypothetical protein BKK79_36765 (plasmid) [Cupriavidus sp. USMAA2-4]|nr:hypothetical protein BKK79_36765 [Cupriavidus sp. USMAA2-4]